jgi:4-amino-4-deoxy-L-arabinose transferase-like glycosyltransferase
VGLVLIGAVELGITHFGTFVDGLEPAGLAQWRDMFAQPRDGRPPEYQIVLLLAYDWPVVLFGGTAVGVFVWRLRRGVRALTSPQLFVLLWTAVAAVAVALASQREAGQLLILLPPLALLAGLLAEQLVTALDWAVLRRWWPVAAAALALLVYAALLTTEWSHPDFDITGTERLYLVLAAGAAAALLVTSFSILGRHAAAISVTVAVVLAFAFLIHTDLALTSDDEAVEFAVDVRTTGRVEQFRETVEQLAASRAGPVLVDPSLREPLAWELRDIAVIFAEAAEDAGAVVVPGGQEVEGFTPLAEPWRLGEGWYPPDLDTLRLWRWFVYREPYGNLDGVDAQILVPAP